MSDTEIMLSVTQFGAAGLMGWMWLSERRSAAVRERQLSEAHERLASERTSMAVLLRAIEANTKALTHIESSQRELINVLARWTTRRR